MRPLLPVVVLSLVAGCFSPRIQSGGFRCDPISPRCPAGFSCVNGRCVNAADGTGGNAGGGGGVGGGGGGDDGGGGGGGGGGSQALDMSNGTSASDLSAPADLAHGGGNDLASGGSCAHSLCVTGGALQSGCDPCVTQICASDNYCCVTKWSSQCVTEVTSICGRSCP